MTYALRCASLLFAQVKGIDLGGAPIAREIDGAIGPYGAPNVPAPPVARLVLKIQDFLGHTLSRVRAPL